MLGAAALLISVAALTAACVRLASLAAPGGLGRALAVVVGVASLAVSEALLLGFVELGSNPIALLIASGLIWLAARLGLPAPELGPGAELAAWIRGLEPRARAIAGVAAGATVAWSVAMLLEPALDIDGVQYHLPEVVRWLETGTPGSVELIFIEFPVGTYPVTNEVLLAWLGALSGNIAVLYLWAPATAWILLASFVAGTRAAGADRIWSWVGAAAVLAVPIFGDSAARLGTDLAASAWLAAGTALAVIAVRTERRAGLLPFAVVAMGLAVGTKTVTAPLAVLVIAWAVWSLRHRRRTLAGVAAGIAGAALVGGVWYARNAVNHGSPLWPFVSLPGSDPQPPGFDDSASFLEAPVETVSGKLPDYLELLGPAPILLLAALGLGLATRSRPYVLASCALGLALLAWANAPFTGDSGAFAADLFAVSAGRYAMPAIVLAGAILALTASRTGAAAGLARATLAVACAWGVVDLALGRDAAPSLLVLVAGAAAGAALAALARSLRPRGLRVAAVGAGALAVIAVSAYPDRYLSLYGGGSDAADELLDTRALFGPLASALDEEGFEDDEIPVFFAPTMIGPLAGGDLDRSLELLDPRLRCPDVVAETADAYVVIRQPPPGFGSPPAALGCLGPGRDELTRVALDDGGSLIVFGPAIRALG